MLKKDQEKITQTIVIFVKNKEIEDILKKYHPGHRLWSPHITLTYPFNISDQKSLAIYLGDVTKKLSRFKITLKGYQKSTNEYYLYLLVNKNKTKIMRLHKSLNSGILSGFENKSMPVYIPHISLGVFNSKKEIDEAIKQLKTQKLSIDFLVDKISLVTVGKDKKPWIIRYFNLNKNKIY